MDLLCTSLQVIQLWRSAPPLGVLFQMEHKATVMWQASLRLDRYHRPVPAQSLRLWWLLKAKLRLRWERWVSAWRPVHELAALWMLTQPSLQVLSQL